MQNFHPKFNLNLIIASLVIGSLFLLGLFNILLKLRSKLPVKVNCWFCNSNSWVPYANFNSFFCKKCEQYNGFTDTGDYNEEIKAQFTRHLNKNFYCERQSGHQSIAANGFCEFCTRNQDLKIKQFSNFRPKVESNFEAEFKEYSQKLEDFFLLCHKCQRVLNKTLNRVKSKLIGSKISQLKKISSTKEITDNSISSSFFLTIVGFVVSIMSLRPDLEFNNMLLLQKIYNLTDPKIDINLDKLSLCGIIVNSLLLNRRKIRSQTIASLFLWCIRIYANEFLINNKFPVHVISILLIVDSAIMMLQIRKKDDLKDNKSTSLTNITNEEEDDISEDEIDFDISYKETKSIGSVFNRSCNMAEMNSNKSFNILKEVNEADKKMVQRNMNNLTLCDSQKSTFASTLNSTLNPILVKNDRSYSPTPSLSNSVFTSVSQRSLISPPRLHSPHVTKKNALCSWVAGGYWPANKTDISRGSSTSNTTSGVGTNYTGKNDIYNSCTPASCKSFNLQIKMPTLFSDQFYVSNHFLTKSSHSSFSNQFNQNNFRLYRDPALSFKK